MIRVVATSFSPPGLPKCAFLDVEATADEIRMLEKSIRSGEPLHLELDGMEADWIVTGASIGPRGDVYSLQSNGPVKGFPS